MIRVVCSGAYDPLHRGHIECFRKARELGDYLIVIMRNDKGILAKKPKIFMPFEDRKVLLEAIRYIDEVFVSVDDDGSSVESLRIIKPDIYAKGGDQLQSIHAPREADVCEEIGCKIVGNIVGVIQSSSGILRRYCD